MSTQTAAIPDNDSPGLASKSAPLAAGAGKVDQSSRGILGRLMGGAAANAATQLVTILGQVLTVPIYLAYWGTDAYGEWMMLTAAVSYLMLLDLGMHSYIANRLNQCYTRGDMGEYHKVLHSGVVFAITVFAVALVVLIPTALVAPLDTWFQLKVTPSSVATVVVIMMIIQAAGALPSGLLNILYRTVGEYPRGTLIHAGYRTVLLAGGILVVIAGAGMRGVALQQVLTLALVSVPFVLFDLRRRHPEIHIGTRQADYKLAFSLLGPSWLFFMIQMSTMLAQQGSALLAGTFTGAASLALFTTLRTLSNLPRQATTLVFYSAWPELTSLETRGEYETLRTIHLLLAKGIVGFTVVAALVLHFCGADVLNLWTRGRIQYDTSLMTAFLLLMVCQGWWMASGGVLAATNNHRSLAITNIVAGALGLLIGALLAPRFGNPGIVHGLWIVDLALCGWLVPRGACKLIGESPLRFAASVLGRGVPVIAGVYLLLWGASTVSDAVAWKLLALPAIAATGALVLSFAIWLSSEERERAVRMLPVHWGKR